LRKPVVMNDRSIIMWESNKVWIHSGEQHDNYNMIKHELLHSTFGAEVGTDAWLWYKNRNLIKKNEKLRECIDSLNKISKEIMKIKV
jgi:hypothetical protein